MCSMSVPDEYVPCTNTIGRKVSSQVAALTTTGHVAGGPGGVPIALASGEPPASDGVALLDVLQPTSTRTSQSNEGRGERLCMMAGHTPALVPPNTPVWTKMCAVQATMAPRARTTTDGTPWHAARLGQVPGIMRIGQWQGKCTIWHPACAQSSSLRPRSSP